MFENNNQNFGFGFGENTGLSIAQPMATGFDSAFG